MSKDNKQQKALIFAAFVAGLCSIVYELLIATTVSYFLGDSVTIFSLTIGLYMAAMGAGSFCSRFFADDLLKHFLILEVVLATLGGLSVPLLYLTYVAGDIFIPTYVLCTLSVGFLIGMEIPFLTRLMESFQTLKSNIANILTFDYIGALLATLAFPFFLLPMFGNYQSSLILGLINLTIVVVVSKRFSEKLGAQRRTISKILLAAGLILIISILLTKPALEQWDSAMFSGRVVHTEQTQYQNIVITHERGDTRLFLNGNIQFSSIDEHRYHEALVSYPLAFKISLPKRVLLLGAGDGLAVKQLLKYESIEEIVLVDLDPRVVELANENPYLTRLNENSLKNDKVTIVHADAYSYLKGNETLFDFIIADLPDPNNLSLARLYSRHFYHVLSQRLENDGMFVTQATSPYYATKAFGSIANTIESIHFAKVIPYHADVPSFGMWGFVMASKSPLYEPEDCKLTVPTTYIDLSMIGPMQVFSKDLSFQEAQVNRLDNPVLLDYYLQGWRTYGY